MDELERMKQLMFPPKTPADKKLIKMLLRTLFGLLVLLTLPLATVCIGEYMSTHFYSFDEVRTQHMERSFDIKVDDNIRLRKYVNNCTLPDCEDEILELETKDLDRFITENVKVPAVLRPAEHEKEVIAYKFEDRNTDMEVISSDNGKYRIVLHHWSY